MLETITTPRLILEPFTEADLEDLHALNSEPNAMRYLDGVRTREQTVAELGRILAVASRPGAGGWTIRERDGRAWVGRIGIKPPADGNEHELLYALREAFWGNGYATEAATALLAHTFARGVDRIMACASPANGASIAVLEKIGMRFDRRAFMYREDVVVYVAP